MDHAIGRVLQIILATGSPQVAVLVPVALQVSIIRARQREAPNVELAILVKQGLLDVFLNDVTAFVTVDLLRLNQRLDVVEVATDLNATAPVRVLARLHNPERVAILGVFLQRFVILRVVETLHEFLKLTVGLTLPNMKSQGQVVEGVLASRFIVDLHVVVNGLLV